MSPRKASPGRRAPEGFTLIEVMMAIAVMLIGTTGIVGMQQMATRANLEARERMVANQLFENWIARLKQDAVAWNNLQGMVTTQYLSVPIGAWVVPTTTLLASPSADYFGQDTPFAGQGTALPRYCVGYRLDPVVENAALRASVVVFWARHAKGGDLTQDFPGCMGPLGDLRPGTATFQRYHAIVGTTLLRRQQL